MNSQPGTPVTAEQATGTKETTDALVSILYHALQGAETAGPSLEDVEGAGDQELVQFLREAQVLLHQRLRQGDGRMWNPEAKIWNLTLMA